MIHSEIIQKANRAAMERWVTGSSDTTQMILSVRAALDVALPALREQIAHEIEALPERRYGGEWYRAHEVKAKAAAIARGTDG